MTYKFVRRSSKNRKRVTGVRWSLPGRKYAPAYMLVASGEFTADQIAAQLDVDISALRKAMSKPYFQEQVAKIRKTEAVLRSHGVPFRSSKELAILELGARGKVRHAQSAGGDSKQGR